MAHRRSHGITLFETDVPTCMCGQQFETWGLFDRHIAEVALRAARISGPVE